MERDQKILISLFKNKVLSLKQIHKYYFNGAKPQAVSYRMCKLKSEELVSKKAMQLNGKFEVYYSISKKGIEVIEEHLLGKITKVGYKSDSIYHDLMLSRLSYKLCGLPLVQNIITESELQSFNQDDFNEELLPFVSLRSDRVLSVKGDDGIIFLPLEYERTLKKNSRIKEKINSYYQHENVPLVIYICESRSMVNSIMKVDQAVSHLSKPKVYFSVLDDVLQAKSQVTFKNSKGDKIAIT